VMCNRTFNKLDDASASELSDWWRCHASWWRHGFGSRQVADVTDRRERKLQYRAWLSW